MKCADIYDNIDYFEPTEGFEELARVLVAKYRLFLETATEAMLRNFSQGS